MKSCVMAVWFYVRGKNTKIMGLPCIAKCRNFQQHCSTNQPSYRIYSEKMIPLCNIQSELSLLRASSGTNRVAKIRIFAHFLKFEDQEYGKYCSIGWQAQRR
jgi:hypothetical protein